MKFSSNTVLALSFVGVLLVLFLGLWGISSLMGGSETTGTEDSGGFFDSIFPFTVGGGGGTTVTNPDGGAAVEAGPVPTVRQITNKEVAGATFAISSGTEVVRYVERETGHIYEVPVAAVTATRLTNTTVPAVHDALWVSASSTILRFLDEEGGVENFYGTFSSTTPDQSLSGSFIKPYNRVALAFGGAALIGMTESSASASVEIVSPAGGDAKSVIVLPLRSMVPVAAGSKVLVASAPAAGREGSVYDTANSRLTKIAGSVPGLEVLSNASGSYLLLSGGGQRVQALSLFSVEQNAAGALPISTTVSKCAWVGRTDTALCAIPKELPLAQYPDDWLLGRVHTNDDLWYINAATGIVTVAVELENATEKALDVSKVVVNSTGTQVVFIDRNDGSLWLASLTPQQ